MSNRVGFRTRTPVKQDLILKRMRREIVEGKLPPGSQLPTRQELELEFQVSSTTLQRALDRLIKDGFIYARGSMGTFVSERLPFVSNYGLVFPTVDSPSSKWNRFWVALKNEADRMALSPDQDGRTGGRTVSVFYGDEGHADGKEYQRLLRHITDHRLAGLIFVSPIAMYRGTPLLTTPGIARVAISGEVSDDVPSVHVGGDLVDKALDFLVAKGRRRVALVTSSVAIAWQDVARTWSESTRARGMDTRPHWVHGVDIRHPLTARSLVNLLMRGDPAERPDGLVIGDDNLVEHATAGLVDAGIKIPSEAEVVAHCNFPWLTPSVLSVKRLGYDVRECLRTCIETIDSQRKGIPLPPNRVAARFEEEVEAS